MKLEELKNRDIDALEVLRSRAREPGEGGERPAAATPPEKVQSSLPVTATGLALSAEVGDLAKGGDVTAHQVDFEPIEETKQRDVRTPEAEKGEDSPIQAPCRSS